MACMDEISPPPSRVSIALRALRQIYYDSATDKAVLGLKSLQAVMAQRFWERPRQGGREKG